MLGSILGDGSPIGVCDVDSTVNAEGTDVPLGQPAINLTRPTDISTRIGWGRFMEWKYPVEIKITDPVLFKGVGAVEAASPL